MANEFNNDFYKDLQNGVVGSANKTELEKRKDDLTRMIDEMESNVIKDPKALENAKKELAKVEKEIAESKAKEAVEKGGVVSEKTAEKDEDKEVKEQEEKEVKEEIKDESSLNEDEKAKENAEKLKQEYYESMMALHEKKMHTISKQKQANELVSSDADYEQELDLEAKMYEARNAYLSLGKEDPYTKKRTELIKIEKEAREPIELELRNRAKRFKEIEEEIKQIDKREREINEELLKEDINETQIDELNKELQELGAKREKLEIELADIKDKLDTAIEIRRQRIAQRAGLEHQHVNTLTYEDKLNYNYQNAKAATIDRNFDQATKQHYDNIKRRIEEREQKIKDINKELKEVPDTDFERRLVLLNELDKETHMLEADRQAKADLDRGVVLDKQEMKQDARDKADNEEYRQKEFDKATDDARAVVAEQKEEIGTAVVENPSLAGVEEKERDATLKAATVAMVVDSPAPGQDTPMQNVKQYAIAKCVIAGLEEQVRNPENPEDAQAMVAHDEQLKEADRELDKVQANIEKQAQI